MHLISERPLREFAQKHVDAAKPFAEWRRLIKRGNFGNLAELRSTFGSVDMVPVKDKSLYVFNISGNKYRLIAAIHFDAKRLFVRHVLTHVEYDSGKWKK